MFLQGRSGEFGERGPQGMPGYPGVQVRSSPPCCPARFVLFRLIVHSADPPFGSFWFSQNGRFRTDVTFNRDTLTSDIFTYFSLNIVCFCLFSNNRSQERALYELCMK